jgi:hypothetical protein
MEQIDSKIIFTDDERTLTGLPECINEANLLETLEYLNKQADSRQQTITHLRERSESCFRGMLPIAEQNLIDVGRLINQLSGIAAPQIIEQELKELSTAE